MLLLVRRNPDAGVLDLEQRRPIGRDEAHLHPAAGGRELEAVRDEVVEHLREARAIALESRHALDRRDQLDPARVGDRRRGLDALLDDLAQVDLTPLDPELAGFDLRKEEQVGDELEEPFRVAVDDLEVPPLVPGLIAVVEQESARDILRARWGSRVVGLMVEEL